MVSHRDLSDVQRPVVQCFALLLAGYRRAIGTRRGTGALGPFGQVVLVLRWFRDHTCIRCVSGMQESPWPPATGIFTKASTYSRSKPPALREFWDSAGTRVCRS